MVKILIIDSGFSAITEWALKEGVVCVSDPTEITKLDLTDLHYAAVPIEPINYELTYFPEPKLKHENRFIKRKLLNGFANEIFHPPKKIDKLSSNLQDKTRL